MRQKEKSVESTNAASLHSAVWFLDRPETIQKRSCRKLREACRQTGTYQTGLWEVTGRLVGNPSSTTLVEAWPVI